MNQERKSEDHPEALAQICFDHQTEIDATLVAWRRHHVTFVTAVVADERRVVTVEVGPALPHAIQDEAMMEWAIWWNKRLPLLGDAIQAGGPFVTATEFRNMPFGPLLTARQTIKNQSAPGSPNRIDLSPLLRSESVDGGVFLDALTYLNAVDQGTSPAEAIATLRNISPRTAEGRIRRARTSNLLSKPMNTRTPSMPTAKAADLIEEALGVRPYPYVTADGTVVPGPTE